MHAFSLLVPYSFHAFRHCNIHAQRWKTFWVVLRVEPSSSTRDVDQHYVGVIEYYKKEEDWKRKHKSLVKGLLARNISVSFGHQIKFKKTTKQVLQLKGATFQLNLAFDSTEEMYRWCEALLTLTRMCTLSIDIHLHAKLHGCS